MKLEIESTYLEAEFKDVAGDKVKIQQHENNCFITSWDRAGNSVATSELDKEVVEYLIYVLTLARNRMK